MVEITKPLDAILLQEIKNIMSKHIFEAMTECDDLAG
jgi:hypothetical protein